MKRHKLILDDKVIYEHDDALGFFLVTDLMQSYEMPLSHAIKAGEIAYDMLLKDSNSTDIWDLLECVSKSLKILEPLSRYERLNYLYREGWRYIDDEDDEGDVDK